MPDLGLEDRLGRYRPSTNQVIVLLVSLVTYWIFKFISFRRSYFAINGSLKHPPFSMWFGSIPAIAEMYKTSPMEVHPHSTMTLLRRKYKLGNLYFLDTWPAAAHSQMVISDPELAAQVTQHYGPYSLQKAPLYPKMIGHISGSTSLLLTEGEKWKKIRSLFNPGFAISHLMTLVPSIVDDSQIFWNKLNELSKSQKVTPLEDLLARLFIDIMGHIILDHDLNAQTTENELVAAFRSAVEWTPMAMATHWIFNLNPMKQFYHWLYARRMDRYLGKVIRDRLEKRGSESAISKAKSSRRPSIDLAMDEYLLQDAESTNTKAPVLDAYFMQVAIDQMKSFLFAGHDTSSSTVCFIYNMLNFHPEALAKVREEHDRVIGRASSAAETIKDNPQLLNELPYTTAVIKETLRLNPPASTARGGDGKLSVIDHDGVAYPTKNYTVWINNHTIHRREDLFPQPDDFIPERFLPAPNNWQEIPKDAWRPFEKGPRGCIGQELAMLEMKIVLALTIRDFDVVAAYEEWDRSLGREKPGDMLDGKRGMFGYRMYGVMKITSKPVDGMPTRVHRRNAS